MSTYLVKIQDAGADTPTPLNLTRRKERAMSNADSTARISFSPLPTHHQFVDETGKTFGRLTVIGFVGKQGGKSAWWCRCECNSEHRYLQQSLRSGASTQCNACAKVSAGAARAKHKLAGTPEYRAWRCMVIRCTDPTERVYANYGGRGITVCERWIDSVENFVADMGMRPSNEYSIDRIDNNKSYCPENCRWATREEQARNKRCTIRLVLDGKETTASAVAAALNESPQFIRRRIRLLGRNLGNGSFAVRASDFSRDTKV